VGHLRCWHSLSCRYCAVPKPEDGSQLSVHDQTCALDMNTENISQPDASHCRTGCSYNWYIQGRREQNATIKPLPVQLKGSDRRWIVATCKPSSALMIFLYNIEIGQPGFPILCIEDMGKVIDCTPSAPWKKLDKLSFSWWSIINENHDVDGSSEKSYLDLKHFPCCVVCYMLSSNAYHNVGACLHPALRHFFCVDKLIICGL
jgi:hypothetical protein